MSRALKLGWYQFRLERRLFWRNPTAAFFSIVLPLVFLALFGALAAGDQETLNILLPGVAAMAIASNTFSALTMSITILRDQGVLKRIRGTALPALSYLAAVIGSAVVNAFAQVAIVVLAGKLFFGLPWPPGGFELVLFTSLGVICLASLGVAYAHVIPDADVASAYMNIVFLPVILISGAFFDSDRTPDFLENVAQALPVAHIVEGLRAAMVTGEPLADQSSGLAIIGLWTVAGVWFAVRGFRWESRRS